MNDGLLEDAKKYGVSLVNYRKVSLPCDCIIKVKEWIEILQKFLDDNELDDADVRIDDDMGGYVDCIYAYSFNVKKSEEDIRKDIELAKEAELQKEKMRKEEEIKTLQRLYKKLGDKYLNEL